MDLVFSSRSQLRSIFFFSLFLLLFSSLIVGCSEDKENNTYEVTDKTQTSSLKRLNAYISLPNSFIPANTIPVIQIIRVNQDGTVAELLDPTGIYDINIEDSNSLQITFTGTFEPDIIVAISVNGPLDLQPGSTIPADILVSPISNYYLPIDATSTAAYRNIVNLMPEFNTVSAADIDLFINSVRQLNLPEYMAGTSLNDHIRSIQEYLFQYANSMIEITSSKSATTLSPEVLESGLSHPGFHFGSIDNNLSYSNFKLNLNTDTLIFNEYRYITGQGFVTYTPPSSQNNSFVLGSAGWEPVKDFSSLEQYNSDGSISLSDTGLDLINVRVESSDLQGKNISRVVAGISVGWFDLLNTTRVFSPGAKMHDLIIQTKKDAYRLTGSPLFGRNGVASSLDELLATSPQEPDGPPAQTIDWTFPTITIEMLTTGTVNYYNRNTKIASSTWTRVTRSGADIIIVDLPDSIPRTEYLDENNRHLIYSVVNGNVLPGYVEKTGDPAYLAQARLNGTAMQDIINALIVN